MALTYVNSFIRFLKPLQEFTVKSNHNTIGAVALAHQPFPVRSMTEAASGSITVQTAGEVLPVLLLLPRLVGEVGGQPAVRPDREQRELA